MTTALKDLPSDEAQELLSAMVEQLVPSPDTVPSDDPKIQSAFAEFRARLKLKKGDDSAASRTKLLNAISEELSDRILTGTSRKRAAARLLKRQLIRAEGPIQFDNIFPDTSFGAQRAHVQSAVETPDAVTVELTDQEIEEGSTDDYVSLYSREIRISDKGAFTWLVLVRFKNGVRYINTAFRVFHEDVDLIGAKEPIEVLRRFVKAFGREATWADLGARLFIEHEHLKAPPGGPRQFMQLMKLPSDDRGDYLIFVASARVSTLGMLDLHWVFVLDTPKYEAALRRHGIHVAKTAPERR
jgi:hypothetical protein